MSRPIPSWYNNARELRRLRVTLKEIGLILGVNKSLIGYHTRDIKLYPHSKKRKDILKFLKKHTIRETASQFNLAYQSIFDYTIRYNIKYVKDLKGRPLCD